ncbi:MAG: MarR family transcriptional regulator [Cyclobacteriaceae bacterium]
MEINKIDESPGYLIESLSRNMRRFSAQQLRESKIDLTLEQVSVLSILDERGSKFQNELADIMSKDNPTLTRILDLLEKKSYLKRELSSGDRRKFLIVLTKEGEKKIAQAMPIIKQIRSTLFEDVSSNDLNQLLNLKERIEGNISNHSKDVDN